ncbi:MAG: hypothetical protein ACAI44_02070 [Candidatus Sericytochromatia bacterium]
MFKQIQDFRQQAEAIIRSEAEDKGSAIIALALNNSAGKPHPGAYPHVVTEMLEQAGALGARDHFKAALEQHKTDPYQALQVVYAQNRV